MGKILVLKCTCNNLHYGCKNKFNNRNETAILDIDNGEFLKQNTGDGTDD